MSCIGNGGGGGGGGGEEKGEGYKLAAMGSRVNIMGLAKLFA